MNKAPSLIEQSDQEFAENKQVLDQAFARAEKNWLDYLALALATFGVGFIKLAPGTWGSMVGVGLYLLLRIGESSVWQIGLNHNWRVEQLDAWRLEAHVLIVVLTSAVGIWAAGRAARILNKKDPSQVVVDEIVGQFIALMFLPLEAAWYMILASFLLFRFFDILKPYPIDSLQDMPGGFGVVVDDIAAGIYAAIVVSIINAIFISLI